MSVGPSASVVRAQVEAIWEKAWREDPHVFGIRAEGGWSGAPMLEVRGERLQVAACRSPLEVRERLARLDGGDDRLILITSLQDADLGEDVLARLARRRLFAVDAWEGAARLFQASGIDPRLRRDAWMANALIEAAPPAGYPAVPAGVLDRDTAWSAFFVHRLGLSDGRPDAVSLLRWTLDAKATSRFESLDVTAKQGVATRFTETAGPVGGAIADCLDAGHGALAVPLGLALRVLFAEQVAPEDAVGLRQSAVRVERYAGAKPIATGTANQWATAAEVVLRESGDPRVGRDVGARADSVLEQVGAGRFAHLSDWSVLGFDQRLSLFGRAIADALAVDAPHSASVAPALDALRRQRPAGQHPDQIRRAEMALRLLRWIGLPIRGASAASLDAAASGYFRDSALVDLSRIGLRAGETAQPLAEAYAALLARAADLREAENQQFGEALVDWIATGSTSGKLLPVEDVIDRVVAPLAGAVPVLLVVVDGMSMAVWREISEDLFREGWVPLNPTGSPIPPGIATVPSVTQFSRASLLSGQLASGSSADEKRAFEAHPALVRASKTQYPPVLFHKGELSQTGGRSLAEVVRNEIASADRQVVAVVFNAVDDYLAKADQVRPRWTLEYVPLVATLVHEARAAGRVVVFASDHGHLMDDETRINRSEYGDRWRGAEGTASEGEVILSGPRVKVPGGRVIVPWSERTRYGMRKNGYHGGATPQEMIVPIAVLSAGVQVPGWVECAPEYPDWWEEPLSVPVVPVPVVVAPPPVPSRKGRPTPLFEELDRPVPVAVPTARSWIDVLLGSSVLATQKQLAGRVAPPDEQLRHLLGALDERGGKLTRVALAQRLGLPLVRLGSFVAAARRVLNVEGYGVLTIDEASDTVELNRELLVAQFELTSNDRT